MLVLARSQPPFSFSFSPLLPIQSREANQLHARLITTGILHCPNPNPIPNPNPNGHRFLWNALINTLDPFPAILTFTLMLCNGEFADEFSFSLALRACSRSRFLHEGSQIHSLVLKSGLLNSSLYLHNSLVTFYGRCGRVGIARQVFDRIPDRDAVSWNSMIDGYVKSGDLAGARDLFDRMGNGEKNVVTWNSMLCGYASSGEDGVGTARELFDEMPRKDSVSWNVMIDGYAKCQRMDEAEELFGRMPNKDVVSWANMIAGYVKVGRVDLARQMFDEMPIKDVVAWNAMIAGYVKNGRFVEALRLFHKMRTDGNVSPDCATLAIALSAVSELGRIRDGVAIHEYIERNRLSLDGKLGVGLIDMYSKCGLLEYALRVFERSGRRSVDHWNAMIGALAVHGYGELALGLFQEMRRFSLRPDDITFISILNACSHAGLVKEGLVCFEIMRREYGLEPKVQHYGCMVDILGRAGRLKEAWKLIRGMAVEPNEVIWKSLLSACRKHDDFDMGLKVAKILLGGRSTSAASYVLLSNIYAGFGMWGDVRSLRAIMRSRDLGKAPGCSWIELDGANHEFVVGDSSHPQAEQVYSLLKDLGTLKMYSNSLYSLQ